MPRIPEYLKNFVTTNKDHIDNHVKAKHVPEENEEVRFICINCKHEFGEVEDYESHVKTHESVKQRPGATKSSPRENIEEGDSEFNEIVNIVCLKLDLIKINCSFIWCPYVSAKLIVEPKLAKTI